MNGNVSIRYTSVSQTVVRGPLGVREAETGSPREIIVEFREKICKLFNTVTSNNLLLKSLLYLLINSHSEAVYYII